MSEYKETLYFHLNINDSQKQLRHLYFWLSKPAFELTFLLIISIWLLLRKLQIITGLLTWSGVFLTVSICIAMYLFSALLMQKRSKIQIIPGDFSIAAFPNYLFVTNDSVKQTQIFLFQDMLRCSFRPCGLYLFGKQDQAYFTLYIPRHAFSSLTEMRNWHKYIRNAMGKHKKSRAKSESLLVNTAKGIGTFHWKMIKFFCLS